MLRAYFAILLIFILSPNFLLAQTGSPEMADALRSNGKIYVVILVVATIFAGIIFFLVQMDRKITKIEKRRMNR